MNHRLRPVFVVRNSEFVLKRYPLGIREFEPLKNPLEAVGLSHWLCLKKASS